MKKLTLLLLVIFTIAETHGQNFLINFKGTGASLIVDSVKVENITQCSSLSFSGIDTLNLMLSVGINEMKSNTNNSLLTYPNPNTGNCLINFEATAQGNTNVSLFDITGKRILNVQEFLSKGNHTYSLNGIGIGIYYLKIESDKFSYSAKIISYNTTIGILELTHTGTSLTNVQNNINEVETNKSQSVKRNKSQTQMQYNPGELLKLTGKSGNSRTISMLIPNNHIETITFNFVNCSDADSNHYAVVQIGNQLWMEENLKTTKYQDGTAISNVPDSASWSNTKTGAYCNFLNLVSEGDKYGRLYNWYAVADNRKICPIGWHVPTNGEWNIMEKFLDKTVDTTVACGGTGRKIGSILKENCNTRWAYLDTTWGRNTSGFTALCSNFRTAIGGWSMAPQNNHDDSFWTSTSSGTGTAWAKSCRWCYNDLFVCGYLAKTGGSSVRCIKN